MSLFGEAGGPVEAICSAKGCEAPATYDVQWNNPKIYTPERRKHWLACDKHQDSLGSYLSARGLLKEIVPFDPSQPPPPR